MRALHSTILGSSLAALVICSGTSLVTAQEATTGPEPGYPANLEELSSDRPWQTNDGLIHFQGRTFASWRGYFDDREAQGSIDHRCGVQIQPDPAADRIAMTPPSDCSCSNTNPAAEYDPSVGMLRIPCVVHVIRNSSGTQGDIPVDRVISGIRILNEDFKALAGTNGANGNDAQIEFYLATVDPERGRGAPERRAV